MRIAAKRSRLYVGVMLVLILMAASATLISANDPLVVRMQGPCDPATFNAAVGAGTCVGDGTITFDHFVKELTAAQNVGAWLFDPAIGTVEPGTVLSLQNRGGETHTFTKVAEFGGGFIPFLNELSGTPIPAPECLTPPDSPGNIFVEAGTTEVGPTAGSSLLPSRTTTKFQCCIHPWMRMEVRVK